MITELLGGGLFLIGISWLLAAIKLDCNRHDTALLLRLRWIEVGALLTDAALFVAIILGV